MKRVGGLFDRIHTFENLMLAARRSRRGKRMRADVLRFHLREEDSLHQLAEALRSGSWKPSGYRQFVVFEPKRRWIAAAPYVDRVVHHAICRVIEPVLERRMSSASHANRRGKGTHRAVLAAQAALGSSRYVLKLDVQQYFPSIDHALLLGQLERVFKERRLLSLLQLVVASGVELERSPLYLPGDDLFTPYQRPGGLPIGNLTSQLFGNFFLSALDHWIAQELEPESYLRFMDDLLLFDHDRERLERARTAVESKLFELRLRLHPRKTVLQPCREGVSFLGYVIERDRIRVRGATLRRFRRRMRRAQRARAEGRAHPLGAELSANASARMAAWLGHAKWAGTWRRIH